MLLVSLVQANRQHASKHGLVSGNIAASNLPEQLFERAGVEKDYEIKAATVMGRRWCLSAEIEVGAGERGSGRGRGYPIGTPALDLAEVATGGGIAWVDSGGILRVGPRALGLT